MTMNKCYGCIFLDEYQDMGARTPICTRCDDLLDTFKAHRDLIPCPWHITKGEIIKLQELLKWDSFDKLMKGEK